MTYDFVDASVATDDVETAGDVADAEKGDDGKGAMTGGDVADVDVANDGVVL